MSLINLNSNGKTLELINPETYSGGENIEYNGEDYLVVIDGNNDKYGIKRYTNSFKYVYNNGKKYDMEHIITTKVTSFQELFKNETSFNKNIESWDTSNVTNMRGMFNSASTFNQDIGSWDTSNVTTMNRMFKNAS